MNLFKKLFGKKTEPTQQIQVIVKDNELNTIVNRGTLVTLTRNENGITFYVKKNKTTHVYSFKEIRSISVWDINRIGIYLK